MPMHTKNKTASQPPSGPRVGRAVPNARAEGMALAPTADSLEVTLGEIEDVITTFDEICTQIAILEGIARTGTPTARRRAQHAQARLSGLLAPPPPRPVLQVETPTFRLGRRIERGASRARQRLSQVRPFPAASRTLRSWWGWGGLVVTALAVLALAREGWLLALTLIAVRIGISVFLGGSANLPYEGPTRDGTASSVVYRCLAGHLTDAVALMGISFVLISSSHPTFGMFTVTATVAMLLASLLRVATLQVGVPQARLTLERVIRGGSMLLAVVAIAVFPSATELLAIAACGALSYAGIETARTWGRLRAANEVFGTAVPKLRLSIAVDGETWELLPHHIERPSQTPPLRAAS